MGNVEKLYLPVSGKTMPARVKDLYGLGVPSKQVLETAYRYIAFSRKYPDVMFKIGLPTVSLEEFMQEWNQGNFEQGLKDRICNQIGDFRFEPNCLPALSAVSGHVIDAMSWLSKDLQDRIEIAKSSIFNEGNSPYDAIGPSNNMLLLNLGNIKSTLVIATLLLSSTRRFDSDNGHEDIFSTEVVYDNYALIRKVIRFLQIKKEIEELKRNTKGIELKFEIRDRRREIKQTISNGSVDPVIYGYLNRYYTEERGMATVILSPRLGFIIRQEGKTPQLLPSYSVPSLHAVIPAYENYDR